MKALFILPFILAFLFTDTFAQNNVSVDPLTGSAQVSIPIWQLSEGDISVPISVNYAGGGVKVEQGEGSAGMSWDLSAGGAVYRDLRGLPDDLNETTSPNRKGWLHTNNASAIATFSPSADDNMATCEDEEDDFEFLAGLGTQDTEPDIFNFYAPGLSGQFVFGNDGLIKTIPYQDLEITYVEHANDSIQSFTIKTNTGYSYSFSVSEKVTRSTFKSNSIPVNYLMGDYGRFGQPLTFTQSWKLSKIENPAGADVTFTYTTSSTKSSINPITVYQENGAEEILYNIKDTYSARKIQAITTNLSSAWFSWEENRVSSISISDNFNGLQRNFNFYYKSVKDFRDESYSGTRNSFLEKIMQEEDCITFPAHEFSYYGVNLSTNKTDLSWGEKNMQDYWGYYNSTSTSKLPDIYVYNNESNAEELRLRPIVGQTASSTLSGASRGVNATAVKTGSLHLVKFPSGSRAKIEYEPNSFFDTISNDTVQGGGVRVKKITVEDFEVGSEDLVTTYYYKQGNGVTSGQLTYRPVYAFKDGTSIIRTADNQAPEGGVLYSRTVVKQEGKGSTVYEFLIPAMYPSTSYSDWAASKSRVARAENEPLEPCVEIGNQTNGYYSYPFAPSTNYDFERGLINKISMYAENETLVMERSFGYQRISASPVNIKALRFDKVQTTSFPTPNFVYGTYQIITNVGKVMITETTRTADEINPSNLIESTTTYTFNSAHKMLESVSSTNSDGILYKTKYKYAKDFAVTSPDTGKPEVVALKYLNDNFRHGTPVETINTRTEGTTTTTVGANLTLYRDYGVNIVLPDKSLIFPQVAGYSETTVVGSSNQQLSIDTDYIDAGRVKSYNDEGLPLSSSDNKKHKAGIHYGYGGSVPVAMVSNAWAEETVYDGFESPSSFSLTPSGTTSIAEGWTGKNALHITSTNSLTRSGVLKAHGKYILSFWVKPNSSGQMNYSCVGGSNVTGNIPYATSGQWQYLEKIIDINGVSSPFELQLSSSVEADLDEVKFYPTISTMTSSTSQPLAGLTSQTDDRGVSNFKEYDELGREKAVLDRNKNTVQRTEYRYKKELKSPLNSNFTSNLSGTLSIGDYVTFTAQPNCVEVSYLWKVYHGTDSTSYTTSQITHQFNDVGNYAVQLTVTSSSGTSTTKETLNSYCVQPDSGGDITFTTGNQTISHCEQNPTRNISVTGLTGCHTTPGNYKWYYKLNSSSSWIYFDDSFKSTDFDISFYGSESFTIKVEITSTCIVADGVCAGSYPFYAEDIIGFTYVPTGDCQ